MAPNCEYPEALMLVIAFMLINIHVMGDSTQEKEKCAQQLAGVATCLPYVGGDAKSPRPDCCSGLKQAIINNKICICLVIKHRDDPDLGLKINITLVLRLPSLCEAPDNLSECPALLHLDPKSAEAQVFNQFGQNSNSNGGSISPSRSPGDEGATVTSPPPTNDASFEGKRFLRSLVAGLLIWIF